jgi:cytidylate kinase
MSSLPLFFNESGEIINIMNKNEKFVITINRELGSGGRTVGRILAEKLGVPYYDKALTKPLEEKFDMSIDQIERLKGNNRSWWENIKRVLILGEDAANSSEYYDEEKKKLVTSEAVLKAEKEILQSIANEESCVIAGRSAFFVTNGHQNRLNILIQASMEHRLARVMAKRGISEKEAKKIIKEVDETREEYMKNNAHTSRYDTRNYDLVIKMDGKTEEEAVNVILAYIG